MITCLWVKTEIKNNAYLKHRSVFCFQAQFKIMNFKGILCSFQNGADP